jgi:hypothetical protein
LRSQKRFEDVMRQEPYDRRGYAIAGQVVGCSCDPLAA